MTEDEKAKHYELKKKTVKKLRRMKLDLWYEVWQTDDRLREYVEAIRKKPDDHNLYEILGVVRILELTKKYEWDAWAARFFLQFYEMCPLSSTSDARVCYKLTPVQAFAFASIYGLYEPEHEYHGFMVHRRRLLQEYWFFVPRKFSKTASAATIACYDLMFGDSNAEAYVASLNQDQSKTCWNEIKGIMSYFMKDLEAAWRKDSNATRLNNMEILFREEMPVLNTRGGGWLLEDGKRKVVKRDSKAKCLTGVAKTKEGLRASVVIVDEYAQSENTAGQSGSAVKTTLTSSFGTRENPLTVVITTASKVVNGPCAQELEFIKKVLRGEEMNDHIHALLFQPDPDDEPNSLKTWKKVQPHLGITVMPDFYEREWANAKKSGEQMLSFMTRMLNMFQVDLASCWIDPKWMVKYQRQCDPLNLELRENERAVEAKLAFDLSESGDMTSVTTTILLEVATGIAERPIRNEYLVHTKFFMPDGADPDDKMQPWDGETFYSQHVNRFLYSGWARQGFLQLIHGPVINYQEVADYIVHVCETLQDRGISVSGIGYDKWKAKEMSNILKAAGGEAVVQAIPQSVGNYTSPCRVYEHWLKLGAIHTDTNPINAYCLQNATLYIEGANENCMPVKISPDKRIDGLITTLMTFKQYIDNVNE